jgi:hypothetical protein
MCELSCDRKRSTLGASGLCQGRVTPVMDAREPLPQRAVTKNKKPLALPLTGALLAVVARRWAGRVPECPFVFHREGRRVVRFDAV